MTYKKGISLVVAVLVAGALAVNCTGVFAQTGTGNRTGSGIMDNNVSSSTGTSTGTSTGSMSNGTSGTSSSSGTGGSMNDTSTTTPGLPNTGFGGNATSNTVALVLTGALAIGGIAYLARRMAIR